MELPTEETALCYHGAIGDRGALMAMKSMMPDLTIIIKNSVKEVPSAKVHKKAKIRIDKVHRRFVNSEGKSSVLATSYAICAQDILSGAMDEAGMKCKEAIRLQWGACNEANYTEKELALQLDNVKTDRGLILHVAKRVPCSCLDRKRREAKAMPKVAYCGGCDEEKLFDDMLQCSGCKMTLYCSESCQRKAWKKRHKEMCPVRARIAMKAVDDED